MPLRCVWKLCLCLALLATQTPSLACNLPLHNLMCQRSLNLLLWMRDSIPFHCVREIGSTVDLRLNLRNVTGPLQPGDRMQVYLQTLHHLNEIYSNNVTSTWDQEKILGFRFVLDEQQMEMEKCAKEPASDAMVHATSAIRTYFTKLGRFLRQKRFSACAWEVIRAKTSRRLQEMLTLAMKEAKTRV